MRRSWTVQQLVEAVEISTSYRQVLTQLKLRGAGANYRQLRKYIRESDLDTSHFTGMAWRRGCKIPPRPARPLAELLTADSDYGTFKLKRRLFAAGVKQPRCEECGWAEMTVDGYLPVEMDHINGDSRDNRLENLRILCPNCHSLKPTHRARNRRKRPGGVTGSHAALKTP